MTSKYFVVSFLVAVIVLLPGAVLAQTSSSLPEEGIGRGGYTIRQSMEVGYRFTDQTGSDSMYDTLVNLQTGPRVLEQSLSMHAQERQGFAFDNFFVNSFGWGGDPNNGLRVRADKSSWYDFRGNFRRDQNFFDYNLLVNPLNPSSSNPNVPVLNSAHQFQTGRRMTDVDLKLLPLSKISFRLGYSRNNMSGPSWSSIHEGTDALLYQPWNTTINSYRLGADWKLLKHTVLSYDQTLDYYKGDTAWQLASFETGILAGGKSVELGLPFDTQRGVPCATPILGTGYVNPACSAYFSYSRTQPVRTSTPTERLTLRSSSVRNLELTASYSYSSADFNMPFDESFAGLMTRTRQVAFMQTGAASSQHVSAAADFAAIWRVSHRFRVSNTFRWDNFRIPGGWNYLTSSLFGATLLSRANAFNPATCPPPFTAATCPQHNASSPADLANDFRNDFLKQDSKQDTLEGEYDFTRRITGRVGVRYEQRKLIDNVSDLQLLTYYPTLPNRGSCAGLPLLSGVCTTTTEETVNDTEKMHGFAALAGVSVRPTNTLRATFDLEQWRANNVFVRIGPRAEARYRFQTSYTPRPWAVLAGSVNILENSNDDQAVDYRGHNRNYGVTASLAPRERFSVDLAYNYSDFLQNGIICFNDTPATGVILPVVTGAGSCTALDSGNPLLTNSYYFNDTNFGMGAFLFKPLKRVTTRVGYSITSVDGKAPQFNILQPDGSLHYKYHQPIADLSVDLGHNVSWNTAWNYYQYKEDVPVGPTAARYFHANTATIALRYAF